MTQLTYLLAAVLFIVGLKMLGSPRTARRGNLIAASGMLIAIVITLIDQDIVNWGTVIAGLIVGALIGGLLAVRVQMTAMPQLVAAFNGFGGVASALVALAAVESASGVFDTETGVVVVVGRTSGNIPLSVLPDARQSA